MEENRFFRFLWRVNAVFLAVAGMALIGVLLMAGVFLISDLSYEDTPPPLAEATNSNDEEDEVQIRRYSSHTNKIDGIAYFELEYGVNSYGKLSSGSVSQTRNIAVLDLATNEMDWIFPNAQQEIEGLSPIKKSYLGEDGKFETITTGQLLSVAVSGANRTITRDIWVMAPDGSDLRKILTDVPVRPDIEYYGDNLVKLILETDEGLDIYPLDIDHLTLGAVTKINTP